MDPNVLECDEELSDDDDLVDVTPSFPPLTWAGLKRYDKPWDCLEHFYGEDCICHEELQILLPFLRQRVQICRILGSVLFHVHRGEERCLWRGVFDVLPDQPQVSDSQVDRALGLTLLHALGFGPEGLALGQLTVVRPSTKVASPRFTFDVCLPNAFVRGLDLSGKRFEIILPPSRKFLQLQRLQRPPSLASIRSRDSPTESGLETTSTPVAGTSVLESGTSEVGMSAILRQIRPRTLSSTRPDGSSESLSCVVFPPCPETQEPSPSERS